MMYKAIKADYLAKLQTDEYDVIGIDEGQFFSQIV